MGLSCGRGRDIVKDIVKVMSLTFYRDDNVDLMTQFKHMQDAIGYTVYTRLHITVLLKEIPSLVTDLMVDHIGV